MSSKVKQLLQLLCELTPIDYAMLTRGQLEDLSDAAFEVSGECEIELQGRGAATHSRQELVPH